MDTFRRIGLALAFAVASPGASTGLAYDDPPKDEALEGLTKDLEEAAKADTPKSDAPKSEEKAPAPPPGPSVKEGQEPKAEDPAPGGGEVAPKDQELDSLLEKLGETTETPSPDDRRGGGPGPSDMPPPDAKPEKAGPDELKGADKATDEHLEELTGRRKKREKDRDGEGGGPLAEVIKEMRDVEKRLGEPDTGEETRKKQAQIVKNLDTIIEQLRSTSGQSQSKSVRMARQSGQKPGSQDGPTPGANGGNAPNTMPAKPSGKSLAGGKDAWGHLPDELRQEMENVFKEEFLTSKIDLIKRYYLSVSQKSLSREE